MGVKRRSKEIRRRNTRTGEWKEESEVVEVEGGSGEVKHEI